MHLDTHVVAWLFAGDLSRFPVSARELLEAQPLHISPMVELELQYLFEIGRTSEPGTIVVQDLTQRIGLGISAASFSHVVTNASALNWTRDPFDRLIVGQALADGVSLLTRDANIRSNFSAAVWE
jgi:PIN domain nuclease of toxin-antitoxin system